MYSVVILSRKADNLLPCVSALREHGTEARIIIVDDGLDRYPEGCVTIPGAKPFCYARNSNLGIAHAGTDDVVLMNDDALLETEHGIDVLAKTCAHNPQYGLIASAVRGDVGNWNQRSMGAGLRPDPRMVCFVCVYIPRRTIDAVGMLDERYVGYGFEDDDMSLRVRRAGLLIGIQDACVVEHGSLHSTFRVTPRPGMLDQNRQIFIDKWGSHPL